MAQPSSSRAAARAALGDRFGARRADDQRRGVRDGVSTCSRPGVRTGTAGRPAPVPPAVRRAPTIWARSRKPPHSLAVPGALLTPAPAAAQYAGVLPLERTGAVPAPGGARGTGRRPCGARNHGAAPAPAPGPCRSPSRAACTGERVGSRAARAASSRARSSSPTVRTRARSSAPAPARRPRGRAQPLSTGWAASTVQLQLPSRKAHLSSAARSSRTSRACGMRGVLLAVACRPRRPRSRRAPGPARARTSPPGSRRRPARNRAAPPATARTASPGPASAVSRACRPVPSSAVSAASTRAAARPVRYDDEGAAPGGEGGGDGPGQLPSLHCGPGTRVPHRPGGPSGGQRVEEGGPVLVARPGAGVRCLRRGQRGRGRALLGAGVARRHGQLEHVGEAARVPVGDRPGRGRAAPSLSTRSGETTWASAASGPE